MNPDLYLEMSTWPRSKNAARRLSDARRGPRFLAWFLACAGALVWSGMATAQQPASRPIPKRAKAPSPPSSAPAKRNGPAKAKAPSQGRPPARRAPVKRQAKPPARREQPILLGPPDRPTPRKGQKPKARKPKARKPKARKPKARKPKAPKGILSTPQVDVIGDEPSSLDGVPGSASILNDKTLRNLTPLTTGDALQTLPGVQVYGEDGMGLRLNVGIRGLDPVRSRKILVLEDGVPVSMAPYGEPEMYYTPRIERMKRLEVVKGSGSILWGPQTIGGVLNMITRDPPRRFRLRGAFRYGSYDYLQAHASVGDTVGAFGYLLEVLHLRQRGIRNLNLALTDVSGKMVIRISDRSILGVKLHFYDESSNATYLGLTTPQFLNNPYANHAIYDRFPIRRYGASFNHKLLLSSSHLFETRVYAHYITRYWQRQDFDRNGNGSLYERYINGQNQKNPSAEPQSDEGIYFLNSTGNRNRAFTIAGIEPRYTWQARTGGLDNTLIVGLRFHYERGDEQYLIGETGASPTGFIRDHENRTTFALAAYVQNRFVLLKRKLQITPGFRFELMRPHRQLVRTRVLQPDGSRVAMDTDIQETSLLIAPIPGLGISYQLLPGWSLFAGVHRGFAPPRTKDSITADGDDLELDPEFSWNYELGLRLRRGRFLRAEVAGFVMDFENQVIAPSESSGAVANDPNNAGKSRVNGGRTLHVGMEVSATFDLPELLKAGFQMPLRLSYTWVPLARYADGLYVDNRLPYSPEHLFHATLSFFHRVGLSASVSVNYRSSMFADKGNTVTPSVNGLLGAIDGRLLLNARLGYTFRLGRRSIGAFVAGYNLTNAVYIESRRPQGIRPGAPLQIIGGIQGAL